MALKISSGCRRQFAFLLPALLFVLISNNELSAQANATKSGQSTSTFGFTDRGDSVEFVFGQQQTIRIGGVEVVLEKRFSEINQVNVAGDFNGWSPDNSKYQMTKAGGTLFKIRVSKSGLGAKGTSHQFKFVLNHQYWIEPPAEAMNKFTGTDGNTNLTLRL